MTRILQGVLIGLLLIVPVALSAQNCCACAGNSCTQTGCINVTSIQQCISYCKKQGPDCNGSRYLQNSDCGANCRRRTKVHAANTGGK